MAELAGRGWSSARGDSRSRMSCCCDTVTPGSLQSAVSPVSAAQSLACRLPAGIRPGGPPARPCCGGAFAEVLTSPLTRCQETARIVAAALGVSVPSTGACARWISALWEEMTFDEVQDRYPEDLQRWKQSASASPTGSSETFAAVVDRMGTTAERLASRYAGASVVAVTHITPSRPWWWMRSGRHHQRCSGWSSRPPASRGSPTPAGKHRCGC